MAENTETVSGMKAINLDASSMVVAVGVVAILMVMIVPLPTFLLDLLLTVSITIGIVILLMSMYNTNPLDFSSFPSILLLTTLYRLALNIASTRLILLHGHEGSGAVGHVIQSFGNFVVSGNYTVGLIIFLIMVLINFIVITKGSGRIAEVAARFTLDAMPGKQMAIDADLNAGLIDEAKAKARRAAISQEAEFYGAMDGSAKFVRGEAIASIIIMVINIVGGLFIGAVHPRDGHLSGPADLHHADHRRWPGLPDPLPDHLHRRRHHRQPGRLGHEHGRRIRQAVRHAATGLGGGGRHHRPLRTGPRPAACAVSDPGHPPGDNLLFHLPAKGPSHCHGRRGGEKKVEGPPPGAPETVDSLLPLDILQLEVGYGLIPLVDESQKGDLLERIRGIRRQFALDMGLVVPSLHVRDNLQIKPDEYVLLLKGVDIARGEVMMGYQLAMDSGTAKREIEGIPTKEPAFNLPALWISDSKKDEAQLAGYTVVDPSTVIATHLTEVLRTHADELLGRQDTQKLLDNLAKTHPKVVEELVPTGLPLGSLQKVLQNLLRERISIRDLLTICETLADYAPMTKDTSILTEYVRQKLARSIVSTLDRRGG